MPLKIVKDGTAGAADGTLVDASHKFAFPALNSVVVLHLRCDDDTYSNDGTVTLPNELEISFDGGGAWLDHTGNPIPIGTGVGFGGLDLGDLNFPMWIRQTVSTALVSGQITTDGTFSACTALGNVTGFTVTPGNAQNALSWTAVANRTAYRIDRATDAGFTTGVALDISPGQTGTSFTDTGRTNGTTYYYRIKAVGTVRYKDSASYATGSGAPPTVHRDDLFTDTDGTTATAHTPVGSVGGGAWAKMYDGGSAGTPEYRVKSNRVLPTITSGTAAISLESWLSGSSNADCAAEVDAYVYSVVSGSVIYVACRVSGASFGARNQYRVVLADDGTLTLGKIVAGTFTSLGTYAVGTLTPGTTYTLRVEAIGTAIKAYVNGVQRISVTDSSVTAGGGLGLGMTGPTATGYSGAGTAFGADAVRLYNT